MEGRSVQNEKSRVYAFLDGVSSTSVDQSPVSSLLNKCFLKIYDPFVVLAPELKQFGGTNLSLASSSEEGKSQALPDLRMTGTGKEQFREFCSANHIKDCFFSKLVFYAKLKLDSLPNKWDGPEAYPWVLIVDLCLGALFLIKPIIDSYFENATFYKIQITIAEASLGLPCAHNLNPIVPSLIMESFDEIVVSQPNPPFHVEPFLHYLQFALTNNVPKQLCVAELIKKNSQKFEKVSSLVTRFSKIKSLNLSSQNRVALFGYPLQVTQSLLSHAKFGVDVTTIQDSAQEKLAEIKEQRDAQKRIHSHMNPFDRYQNSSKKRRRRLKIQKQKDSVEKKKIITSHTFYTDWELLFFVSRLGNYPDSTNRPSDIYQRSFELRRVSDKKASASLLNANSVGEFKLRCLFREYMFYVINHKFDCLSQKTPSQRLLSQRIGEFIDLDLLRTAGHMFRESRSTQPEGFASSKKEFKSKLKSELKIRQVTSALEWFHGVIMTKNNQRAKSDSSKYSNLQCPHCTEDFTQYRTPLSLPLLVAEHCLDDPEFMRLVCERFFNILTDWYGPSVDRSIKMQLLVFGSLFHFLGVSKGCLEKLLFLVKSVLTINSVFRYKGKTLSVKSVPALSRFLACNYSIKVFSDVLQTYHQWAAVSIVPIPKNIQTCVDDALSHRFMVPPQYFSQLALTDCLYCRNCLSVYTIHSGCGPSTKDNGILATSSARRLSGHTTRIDPVTGQIACGRKTRSKVFSCHKSLLSHVDCRSSWLVVDKKAYGFCPQPQCGVFAEINPMYSKWNQYGWMCRICVLEN